MAFALVFVATGCVVGPDYRTPEPDVPDRWHQELVRGLGSGDADLRTWWTLFRDPTLDSLIERASTGSLDLREAFARILEARALRGIAIGDFFPDADGIGTEQRTRESDRVTPTIPPPGKRSDDFYQLGGDVIWEVDLWGRLRRSVESADAGFEASVEDYRDVLVSLYAEVATTYVEVRSLQDRVRYTIGNIETQAGSLKLTEDRRDAGIGSDLDVSQAELNLATTEAFLPTLRTLLARAVHRLGVLLGEPPASLWAELETPGAIPSPPTDASLGLPAELLRQRPDVRAAERQLAAQSAQVGVATAALYPTFSLVGTFGYESFDASELIRSGSNAYSFGPSLRWNIFDGGRVRSAIQAEDARTEQAHARYEATVLRALEETENALVAYVQQSERRDALERSVEAARHATELVDTLYRTGLTDFQNVLDTERSLFQQEDAFAQSAGSVSQNLIEVYRALGGGWSPDLSPAP